MKMKSESYVLISIMLLMLFVIATVVRSPYIEVKLLPTIIGIFVFVLTTIELWRAQRTKKATVMQEESHERLESGVELSRFIAVISWILGFAVGVFFVGIVPAAAIFSFTYLKLQRKTWFISAGYAFILTSLIYMVFELALKLDLYKGLIFM